MDIVTTNRIQSIDDKALAPRGRRKDGRRKDGQYTRLVNEAAALVHNLQKVTIGTYYELGRRVDELCNEANKKGRHSIRSFAEDIGRRTGWTLKESSLYKCRNYYLYSTDGERALLEAHRVPWRTITMIYTHNVSLDARTSALRLMAEGTVEPAGLSQAAQGIEARKATIGRVMSENAPRAETVPATGLLFTLPGAKELAEFPANLFSGLDRMSPRERERALPALRASSAPIKRLLLALQRYAIIVDRLSIEGVRERPE